MSLLRSHSDVLGQNVDHLENLLSPTISSSQEAAENAPSPMYITQTFEAIAEKFTKQDTWYSVYYDGKWPVPGEVCVYADFFRSGEIRLRLCWKPKEVGEESGFICHSPPRLSWLVSIKNGKKEWMNRQRTSAQWSPKPDREYPYITQEIVLFTCSELKEFALGNSLKLGCYVHYHPALSPLDGIRIKNCLSNLHKLYRAGKLEDEPPIDVDRTDNKQANDDVQINGADYQCQETTGKPHLEKRLKELSEAVLCQSAGAQTWPWIELIEKEIVIGKVEEEIYTRFEQIGPFRARLLICLSKEPQDGEDIHEKLNFKISLCVRPGSDENHRPFWPVTMNWIVSERERRIGEKNLTFSRPPERQDSSHSFDDSIDLKSVHGRFKYTLKVVPSLLDDKAQLVRDSLDGIKASLSDSAKNNRGDGDSQSKNLGGTNGQSKGFEYYTLKEHSRLFEATVAFVGSCSVGKTETANSLLQRQEFPTNTATRHTMEACITQRRYALKVVDTPGLRSGEDDDTIVPARTMLSQALLRCKPGFQVLLFVINFENFSDKDLNAAQTVKRAFGEDILKHFGVCIITHANAFSLTAPGMTFNEWRAKKCKKVWSEEAWKLLEEFGNRCVLFDNTSTDPDVINEQGRAIIAKIHELLIKKEDGLKVTYSHSDLALHLYHSIHEGITPLLEQVRQLVNETEDGPWWERRQSAVLTSLETLMKKESFVDRELSAVWFKDSSEALEALFGDISHYEPIAIQGTQRPTLAERIVEDIENYRDKIKHFLESATASLALPALTRRTLCWKHWRHEPFFSIAKFGIDKIKTTLPPGLLKEDVVRWVKCWARFVVRIQGQFVSDQRPETHSYILSDKRGQRYPYHGSGHLSLVHGPVSGPCPCETCSLSRTRRTSYYQIRILSCRHNVFDDSEAKQCSATFFFDNPGGKGSRAIAGSAVIGADTEKDCCILLCYTHDLTLGQQLQELCSERSELVNSFAPVLRDYTSYTLPVFVVSHPHGCEKQISLGDYEGRDGEMLIYRVPTCHGHSGGLVLPLGLLQVSDSLMGLASFTHSSGRPRKVSESTKELKWWWLG